MTTMILHKSTGLRRRLLSSAMLGIALTAVVALAQSGDPFFDSTFDGTWSGTATLATAGGRHAFPIVVNVDVAAGDGAGYLLVPDSLTGPPADMDLLRLDGVTAQGKRLTLTATGVDEIGGIEAGFTHTLKLRFKAKSGELSGTLTSTDPEVGKGKVVLVRNDPTRPVQGVWTGSAKLGGGRRAVILQVEQEEATSAPGQEAVTSVSGSAIVGDEFGDINNGTFDGRRLIAQVQLDDGPLQVSLAIKKRALKGTIIESGTGPVREASLKLLAAGTRGKVPAIGSVSPADIEIGARTEVTVRGKNISPGSLLHADNDMVTLSVVEVVSSKSMRAVATAATGLAEGVEVSLRVVGPDGAHAERDAALTTVNGGGGGGATVSFAAQVQPVFTESCAFSGCHLGPGAAQGMDLSSGSALGAIVSVASNQMPNLLRIAPGDADNSYLIRKIKGQGISGQRMPLGNAPLGSDIITLFETWVREGAQDN